MTRSAPIGAASPRIVAIDETDAGTRLLQRFYGGLYTAQFPDPDERELLANMLDYIRKRAAGWYGPNNYHALIAVDGDAPVGGVIADYLARPNAGVIEFLTASPDRRRQGIGRLLHAAALDRFAADAGRAHGRPLDYVFAEMNDPSRTDPATDNMDPAERAAIWAAWDYRAIGFPYVQPALSPAQSPVTNLLLLARPCGQAAANSIPAATVRDFLADYMRWAMRIDAPEANAEYRAMSAWLAGRERLALLGPGQGAARLPQGSPTHAAGPSRIARTAGEG